MINISDIYTAIFELISSATVRGINKINKRKERYSIEVENTPLEMNVVQLESEI
ncbi:MAG: hypothetical protein AAFN93_01150 [Bacteroidota bacterium]